VCVCVCVWCAQCAKRPPPPSPSPPSPPPPSSAPHHHHHHHHHPGRHRRRRLAHSTLQCVTLHSSRSALLHRRHSSVYYLRHRTPTNHKLTASVRPSVCPSVSASASMTRCVWQALCTAQRFSIIFGDCTARRALCRCDMILMCAIV